MIISEEALLVEEDTHSGGTGGTPTGLTGRGKKNTSQALFSSIYFSKTGKSIYKYKPRTWVLSRGSHGARFLAARLRSRNSTPPAATAVGWLLYLTTAGTVVDFEPSLSQARSREPASPSAEGAKGGRARGGSEEGEEKEKEKEKRRSGATRRAAGGPGLQYHLHGRRGAGSQGSALRSLARDCAEIKWRGRLV
jgi:hypothetical protein